MVDVLASLLALLLIVAILCAIGVALTVAPFVVAVDMAERHRFSPALWGGLSVMSIGLALVLAYVCAKQSLWLMLLPLLLAWAVPAVLALLSDDDRVVAGPVGAHE